MSSPAAIPRVVLASASPYRKALLERLLPGFEVRAPDVDETPQPGEAPAALAARLARAKALAVAAHLDDSLVIGSDQVAHCGEMRLGKPGGFDANVTQLLGMSGRRVNFLTGVCVVDTRTGGATVEVVPYEVIMRDLSRSEIEAYVAREQPYDCAAGFKCEGLGVALLERMSGDDPTALVGLPLMALTRLLASAGVDPLLGPEPR